MRAAERQEMGEKQEIMKASEGWARADWCEKLA